VIRTVVQAAPAVAAPEQRAQQAVDGYYDMGFGPSHTKHSTPICGYFGPNMEAQSDAWRAHIAAAYGRRR
jgi:hypothetical protein